MKLLIKVLACSVLLVVHLSSIAEPLSKFDTKNHPKSNGLWLTVKYPSSWRSDDGERPHIIRKFDHVDGKYYEGMMLQVNPMPQGSMQEVNSLTTKDMAEVYSSFSNNVKVNGITKFVHEGQPAFIGDINYSIQRVNQEIFLAQRLMVVFYKSNMIMLWCGTGAKPEFKDGALQKQQVNSSSVCQQFFNSLVLMDRY